MRSTGAQTVSLALFFATTVLTAEPVPPGPLSYVETIVGERITVAMQPIPAGQFLMGSPNDEPGRREDEGPQRQVRVDGFWMGKYEVTWRQFRPFLNEGLVEQKKTLSSDSGKVDAVSGPSPISWHIKVLNIGMKDDQPVAGITQYAAKRYCQWLSRRTGHYYRLPTEAEWEYACRAGQRTAYYFGDNANQLEQYAWFATNAYDVRTEGYRPVGQKQPNAWGLYDMHGNVAEWVLDGYAADSYAKGSRRDSETVLANPFVRPASLYPRVARGGSWMDEPDRLRSAARAASNREWKEPIPAPSLWYLRSGEFVGFRLVRPYAKVGNEDRRRAAPDKFQQ